MAIGDLGLMGTLRTKMQWHQARQRVLAENVANADTPRYRGKDLKAPDLPAAAGAGVDGRSGVRGARVASVSLAVTQPGHSAGTAGARGFKSDATPRFEVTPNGNAVDIEEEMAKSAENQLEYQTAASLYQQSMSLIRTALGRR
ncbi:MAG: flagellar basal body protein [Siculibacillus sp.]|nr:flagellar basal body protein [Siculibacillus sp.]